MITWIAFPGKIHFILPVLIYNLRSVVAFESSSKFRFSTSYDLKTTKLSRLHYPIAANFRLFEPIMFSCILKKRKQISKQTDTFDHADTKTLINKNICG